MQISLKDLRQIIKEEVTRSEVNAPSRRWRFVKKFGYVDKNVSRSRTSGVYTEIYRIERPLGAGKPTELIDAGFEVQKGSTIYDRKPGSRNADRGVEWIVIWREPVK